MEKTRFELLVDIVEKIDPKNYSNPQEMKEDLMNEITKLQTKRQRQKQKPSSTSDTNVVYGC